jgi:uncharacterized protein YbbK (DUF523 family)
VGLACRYDGRALPDAPAVDAAAAGGLLPVCPEQLGGLPTPRPPAQIRDGDGDDVLDGRARVVDETGADVTQAFLRGAEEVAALCERLGIQEVLLKSHSPSCGVGTIYRGQQLIAGNGVTVALLLRRGIRVTAYPDE